MTLTAGANITITPSGNTLTIAASDTSGISRVVHDTTLAGDGTGAMPLGIAVPLNLTVATSSPAIFGTSATGPGVRGASPDGIGVLGTQGDIGSEITGKCGVGGIGDSVGVVGSGKLFGVEGSAREASDGGAGVVGNGGGGDGDSHAGVGVLGQGGSGEAAGGPDTSGGTGVVGNGGAHPTLGGDGVVGIGADAPSSGTNTGGNGVVGIGGDGAQGTGSHGTGGTAIMGFGGIGSDDAAEHAGYFEGNVVVTGQVSTSGGTLKIDHPLDPENKYLSQSIVESPDMKDIYDGVAVLDANGEATVELPEWFSALNRDFRYQLTSIGAPAPGLYVATEVADNRFGIAGGAPGMKVSWQLTGIRQDAYANAHRIPVEEDKPPQERGKYLHPKEFGQPESKGIEFARQQAMQPGKTPSNPQGDAP